jgi:signal transduction histidine kinase
VVTLQVGLLEEELLHPASDSREQVAQCLTDIKTHLARLNDLVQNYLSLVRVSTIVREPVDMHTVLTVWTQEMVEVLAARSITLQCDGLATLGTVALHQSTFRRALLNLLHNAMDAMPQGGVLSLRGRRQATQVQLEIGDSGSGIAAEDLQHIFEPLYTTKPGGTGLGLYIVQEIITAHGGQITVQSARGGGGTTFTITLPVTLAALPRDA